MPNKATVKKAKRDLAGGKSPTTAAGEFVHEEIDHVRKGQHGARSTKQAIAIGLSKARRAGVPLRAPAPGRASDQTRRSAERDLATGQGRRKPRAPSSQRSRSSRRSLKREGRQAGSRAALSRQAKRASRSRSKRS